MSALRFWIQVYFEFGGERGIRTPGGFPLNGFQDRRFRPLSQLSCISLYQVAISASVDIFSYESGGDRHVIPGSCPTPLRGR